MVEKYDICVVCGNKKHKNACKRCMRCYCKAREIKKYNVCIICGGKKSENKHERCMRCYGETREIKKYDKCLECGKDKTKIDGDMRYALCVKCAGKKRGEKQRKREIFLFCVKCRKPKETKITQRKSLCKSCGHFGILASEETRKLWSEQRKGRPAWNKGISKEENPQVGKKRTLEQRTKLSNSKTGFSRTPEQYEQYLLSNEKNNRRFKIGKNYDSKEWAKSVKQRDSWQCILCKSNKNLCAHHIKSWVKFPKERYDLQNGVCLCKKCHKFVHSKNNKKMIYVVK